jgi:hypothetical protein
MRPERTFKVGPVQASVFLNEFRNGDGARKSYSVNLHRRFQEKETQAWKSNSVFRLSELPQAQLALQLATAYVAEHEASLSHDTEHGAD